MFNTYTYDRKKITLDRQQKQQCQLQKWTMRYKTQVQPYLVSRYQRRINGFAKKMQDQPVILKIRKDGRTDDILVRKFDKKLNLGQDNFRFKSQSNYNRQKLKDSKFSKITYQSVFRSVQPQQKYVKTKVQYRSRDKNKEINPPMKYTNKNSQIMLMLPKMKNNKQNRHNSNQTQILHKNLNQSLSVNNNNNIGKRNRRNSVFMDDDYQVPQNLSYGVQFDNSSNHNSHVNKKNIEMMQKTQIQLIQQQQMKALAQRKLYFKSLIDLQQNVKTAKQRNNLRQILTKCGVFKPISGKLYEQQQVDKFLEFMKTKQW